MKKPGVLIGMVVVMIAVLGGIFFLWQRVFVPQRPSASNTPMSSTTVASASSVNAEMEADSSSEASASSSTASLVSSSAMQSNEAVVSSESSPAQSSSQQASLAPTEGDIQDVSYYGIMKAAYARALAHQQANEKEGRFVQAPFSAVNNQMIRLSNNHPEDEAMINKAGLDYLSTVRYDKERINRFIKGWSTSMGQQYQRVDTASYTQVALYQLFNRTTVNGHSERWNLFGYGSTEKDYDYLVLDAWQDVADRHLYLLTLYNGEPMVLYAHTTWDQLVGSDFKETENKALRDGYRIVVKDKIEGPEIKKLSTDDIIQQYGNAQGERYLKTSPATHYDYYDLAVPDSVLESATVDGRRVSFRWYDWFIGSEGVKYDLVACYINEQKTKIILFAYLDGNPVLLQTTEPPTHDGTIPFHAFYDELLMKGFN